MPQIVTTPADSEGMHAALQLVVVVDDSLVVRTMLSSQLQGHGYEVVTAIDGESALALCAERPPDVILLDLNLPGISGYDVLVALRSEPLTVDTPVIILSERQAAEDAARGLKLGAHDYLRKPVHPIELTARVDAALRLRAAEADLRQRNAQLELANRTDFLTGLANRRHLDGELTRACAAAERRGGPLGLLIVDLDQFKQINDVTGHVAGDTVLREIARRIEPLMRAGDTPGRWGGDEFLVLMSDTDASGLTMVAERLRRAVADEPVIIDPDHELFVTVTIGGAMFDATDVDAFVRAADVALYEGKSAGGDAVVIAGSGAGGAGQPCTPPREPDHFLRIRDHIVPPPVASRP